MARSFRHLACCLLALGCGRGDQKVAAATDAAAARVDAAPAFAPERKEIVTLEAQREAGVKKLEELARGPDARTRAQAILALGRTGGPLAVRALMGLLPDSADTMRIDAARALGLTEATEASPELAKLYVVVTDPAARAAIAEALGRVGDDKALPVLAAALGEKDPGPRAAAAIALGRYGRRKIAIGDEARAALLAHGLDPDPRVRYGVAYALAREVPAVREPPVEAVLGQLARDADAEVRAVALSGLSARGAPAEKAFVAALDDEDWRVRVQAARGLSAEKSTPAMRARLAAWLVTEWTSIADLEARLLSPRVHPILDAIPRLTKYAREPAVRAALDKLNEATDVTESSVPQKYTAEVLRPVDAVNCLTAVARVQTGKSIADVLRCGEKSGAGWPHHERRRLAAQLVGEGLGGTLDQRVVFLLDLARDADSRVRAAAAAAAVLIDDSRTAKIVRQAMDDKEALVAGAAADAMLAKLESNGKPTGARLDVSVLEAVIARAQKEEKGGKGDAELRLSLLETLRAAKLESAVPLCRNAFADPNPTLRETGRKCLKELTGQDPGRGAPDAPSPAPPIDPATVLGRKVVWTVETTKGKVVIELDPDLAPWNVANLTTLARKGFYDGTLFHRVVPDFVVQGGDPTGSGWGGPGYAVLAEASTTWFQRGAVGIADAGKDTGGSQWFVMHSRAPHLDGRYTLVGRVLEGMEVVDALVVGDQVKRVQVQVTAGGAGQTR
jgi:cyclophilin family peptidyl-prolyl cis-trans isomerase/HEAT repeat protein